jgi:hypothetical protein
LSNHHKQLHRKMCRHNDHESWCHAEVHRHRGVWYRRQFNNTGCHWDRNRVRLNPISSIGIVSMASKSWVRRRSVTCKSWINCQSYPLPSQTLFSIVNCDTRHSRTCIVSRTDSNAHRVRHCRLPIAPSWLWPIPIPIQVFATPSIVAHTPVYRTCMRHHNKMILQLTTTTAMIETW